MKQASAKQCICCVLAQQTAVPVSGTASPEAEETLLTQTSGAHAFIHLNFILALQADGFIGSIGT